MKGLRIVARSLTIIILGCVFYACNYPETSPSAERTAVCPPDSLLAPAPVSPSKLEVTLDLSPEFHWEYPTECDPEKFTIEVIFHPLIGLHDAVMKVEVEGSIRSWSSEKFLPEGKQYGWRISAISGDVAGPSSDYAFFFTGPICEETLLVSPELIYPGERAVVGQPRPWLHWQYPESCLPDTFLLDLAESPSFSEDSLAAVINHPIWGGTARNPLLDCTQYFWRVAARVGEQLGPFSSTRQFWTDFSGTCDFTPVHTQEQDGEL